MTPDERRQRNRASAQRSRSRRSEAEAAEIRETDRARKREWRAALTPDQLDDERRRDRNQHRADYWRTKQTMETSVMDQQTAPETRTERTRRIQREWIARKRAAMTPEQKAVEAQKRKPRDAKYKAETRLPRAAMSPEQRNQERTAQRAARQKREAAMTPAEHEAYVAYKRESRLRSDLKIRTQKALNTSPALTQFAALCGLDDYPYLIRLPYTGATTDEALIVDAILKAIKTGYYQAGANQ